MDKLLSDRICERVGSRNDVVRACALASDGFDARLEVRPAGGGGTTAWSGMTSLYVNTANSRPHAGKYRNLFWREPRGSLRGQVLMSWFPGRGQRLTDPSVARMLSPNATMLLWLRKQPSRPFVLCGRLRAVALAAPSEMAGVTLSEASRYVSRDGPELEGAGGRAERSELEQWQMTDVAKGASVAPHVVFQLVDADTVVASRQLLEELFGVGGLSSTRPAQYSTRAQDLGGVPTSAAAQSGTEAFRLRGGGPGEAVSGVATSAVADEAALPPASAGGDYFSLPPAALVERLGVERACEDDWITVCGFGSLMDRASASETTPSMRNFRLGWVEDYCRVFNLASMINIRRGRANGRHLATCTARRRAGSRLRVCLYEVPVGELPALALREARLRLVPARFSEDGGDEGGEGDAGGRRGSGHAVICAELGDAAYRAERCVCDDEYEEQVGQFYSGDLYRDDLLPVPSYLLRCVRAHARADAVALSNFLDESFLGDGKTPLRAYLASAVEEITADPIATAAEGWDLSSDETDELRRAILVSGSG